ncbi:MAG: hypothetical protein ACREMY_05050 [bacterium]
MQGKNAQSLQHRALTVAPGPSRRSRRLKGALYCAAVLAVIPAGIAIDGFLSLSGALRGTLVAACFGAYLFFGSKTLSTWFPGLDRRWRVGSKGSPFVSLGSTDSFEPAVRERKGVSLSWLRRS